MTIRVKLFAILRDTAGVSDVTLDLPEKADVGQAIEALGRRLPQVRESLNRSAFAVNQSYVKNEQLLRDGDELAVIPPVSGG